MKINSKYYFSPESAWKKVVRKTQSSDFKNYTKEELVFQKSETSSSIDQDALSINYKRSEEDKLDGNCMNLSSILIRQLVHDDLGHDHDKFENLNSIVNELNLDNSNIKIMEKTEEKYKILSQNTLMQEEIPIKIEKIFKITRNQNTSDLENVERSNQDEDLWSQKFNEFDLWVPIFKIQRISRNSKNIWWKSKFCWF